jgi:DNA-binding MarR family transcriptional regulator
MIPVPCGLSVYNTRNSRFQLPLQEKSVHHTRMDAWADELHLILLKMAGRINRPEIDAAFLARAKVKLDRALFPLLSRIGVQAPIGIVELAALTGRDHSTVSRQVAKLEALGLVERAPHHKDRRMRLLRPTAAGKTMLDKLSRVRRRMIGQHFADWTEAERHLFLSFLKRAFDERTAKS